MTAFLCIFIKAECANIYLSLSALHILAIYSSLSFFRRWICMWLDRFLRSSIYCACKLDSYHCSKFKYLFFRVLSCCVQHLWNEGYLWNWYTHHETGGPQSGSCVESTHITAPVYANIDNCNVYILQQTTTIASYVLCIGGNNSNSSSRSSGNRSIHTIVSFIYLLKELVVNKVELCINFMS